MIEIIGTEKQVAWATDIRAKFAAAADALIAEEVQLQEKRIAKTAGTSGDKLEKLNKRIEKYAAIIEKYRTRTAEILNEISRAGWWIEYGQGDADCVIREFDSVKRGVALGGVNKIN